MTHDFEGDLEDDDARRSGLGDDDALREADLAAAEAAKIGGPVSEDDPYPDPDDPDRALIEGGEGESEGFEQAEEALIDHASHGDQHAARRIIEDAELEDEGSYQVDGAVSGEGDGEYSSERPDADH
jgi:hypothetical protein